MDKNAGRRLRRRRAAQRHSRLTHGLRTADILMPGEFRADWHHFHDTIVDEFSPETPVECELVEQVALTLWRLRRIARAEAALASQRPIEAETIASAAREAIAHLVRQFRPPDDQTDVDDRHSAALAAPSPPQAAGVRSLNPSLDPIASLIEPAAHTIEIIARYEAHLSRHLERSLAMLTAVRRFRALTAGNDTPESNVRSPARDNTQTAVGNARNRFESGESWQ
jgi:hypothetical protein